MCSPASHAADSVPLPSRQVHLDFHTSEHIPEIGKRFDKTQFQEALRIGRVNQINIFAKGHHSWSYYPTEVGTMHPHLDFDLLGAQIEACHEIGVRCPIYYTVGWSATDAEVHPDWCSRHADGSIKVNGEFDEPADSLKPKPWGWKKLCAAASGPYHAHMMAQVEEICRRYDVDGLWFDIYNDTACYCDSCRDRMATEGVDLEDEEAVLRSHTLSIKQHMQEMRDLIARHDPEATVYFNSATHVGNSMQFRERLFDLNTQQELEDLPTVWGGYDKLPIEAKFHLGEGSPVLAMSGKFHKMWGEFGGFKHPDAITYEAAAMISHGAACNFGDQLHPSGEMDLGTYHNIGRAYAYVEQIEDYGIGGVPYAKLGLWLTLDDAADRGVATMLLEMHYDFVIANPNNLDELNGLVIPSQSCLSPQDARAINGWVDRGGKLLVFGEGAISTAGGGFALEVGADYLEPSTYDIDYTVMKADLGPDLVSTPFLNNTPGVRTQLTDGQALAMIREPYFSRTYRTYSSHLNTPFKLEDSSYPAVVRRGNVIFFAHPFDRIYYHHGVRMHRDLFQGAIDLLDPPHVLRVKGLPSAGRVSLLKQADDERYVAHLLYGPPHQRGDVKVIEDLPPIAGATLALTVPEMIKSARTIPAGDPLPLMRDGSTVSVAVPTFAIHTGIVFEY
ncbi:MAG: hypothetical protein SynsKO_18760 [Synoicihabitans sp.]